MKSITPARGHYSLRAHATRNLSYFLYECSCTHFNFFNLWDVSPVAPTPFGFLLLFFFVLYYKFIFYITRGAPNKAVKKKRKSDGKLSPDN